MEKEFEQRISRLEQKVSTLRWLTAAQAVMIGVLATAYVIPLWAAVVVIPLIALPVLVLCRRMLPGWARRCGRFLGGFAYRSPRRPRKVVEPVAPGRQ